MSRLRRRGCLRRIFHYQLDSSLLERAKVGSDASLGDGDASENFSLLLHEQLCRRLGGLGKASLAALISLPRSQFAAEHGDLLQSNASETGDVLSTSAAGAKLQLCLHWVEGARPATVLPLVGVLDLQGHREHLRHVRTRRSVAKIRSTSALRAAHA